MLAGFVKYLPSVRMDCTVTRFAVSCSWCAGCRQDLDLLTNIKILLKPTVVPAEQ